MKKGTPGVNKKKVYSDKTSIQPRGGIDKVISKIDFKFTN